MTLKRLGICLLLVITPTGLWGQEGAIPWSDMKQFFQPPPEYQGQLGEYRSLMKFTDGTPVQSREDWPGRRQEILKEWHAIMGPWPELVQKPRTNLQEAEHVENFTRHRLEVEVSPGRVIGPMYLLIPDGPGPFPAVLVTWYGSADSAGVNEKARGTVDFGYQLAKQGFVTLCIGNVNQEQNANRKPIQPLSYMAYVAANCCNALENLPQVDPKRIGVVGHSFGGKWAMFASCLHDRFACAVWVDPGIVWNELDSNANYWEKWYLGHDFNQPDDLQRKPGVPTTDLPRTGAYKTLLATGRDMHELHALMAPRPFLVSGGAQDRPDHWIALNHSIALNEFLGQTDRVAMTMRNGHTPTLESNAQIHAFFKHFLQEPRK